MARCEARVPTRSRVLASAPITQPLQVNLGHALTGCITLGDLILTSRRVLALVCQIKVWTVEQMLCNSPLQDGGEQHRDSDSGLYMR